MKGYFSIWGYYRGKWEKIDSANSSNSAIYLANEYALAFGREWEIEIRFQGHKWNGE